MYDMERERNLLKQIETEPMANPDEMNRLIGLHATHGYLAAAEDRAYPLHDLYRLPARWLGRR